MCCGHPTSRGPVGARCRDRVEASPPAGSRRFQCPAAGADVVLVPSPAHRSTGLHRRHARPSRPPRRRRSSGRFHGHSRRPRRPPVGPCRPASTAAGISITVTSGSSYALRGHGRCELNSSGDRRPCRASHDWEPGDPILVGNTSNKVVLCRDETTARIRCESRRTGSSPAMRPRNGLGVPAWVYASGILRRAGDVTRPS